MRRFLESGVRGIAGGRWGNFLLTHLALIILLVVLVLDRPRTLLGTDTSNPMDAEEGYGNIAVVANMGKVRLLATTPPR